MGELENLSRRFGGHVPGLLGARAGYAVLCPLVERPEGVHLLFEVRSRTVSQGGEVCFPGGRMEPGEMPQSCALRETWEETGLTLTDYQYRGIVTFVSDQWETEYMHVFTATGWTGELIECNEGVLEWIHKDQLMKLPLWAGDKLFLDLIHEPDTPFFSMKLRYEGERLAYAALNGKELNT